MEIIENNLKEIFNLPKNFVSFYKHMNFAIFDIETTGLNPNDDQVILIGLLYLENGNITIKQFFCNNRNEELSLLKSFIKVIKHFDILINYNGNTFDIPFLNKRFLANKINYSIESYKSIDILKLIRKVQKNLNLKNCKLKSIEKYLGIHRNDTISGKESVSLYAQFEKNQNIQLKNTILLHNYDDLYYLGKSLMILDQISHEQIISCFPQVFYTNDNMIYVTNQIIKNGTLYLKGICKNKNIDDYVAYESSFSFEYTKETNTFSITIPLYKGRLSSGSQCLYIDTNDFSFLYSKVSLDARIPKNIILFKIDKKIQTIEIHSFISILIPYIFKKIT
ncbi:ribonuclease H-like domain-containing protein [Crassaminicella thermophila]|uniref:ribonuclease H-like domain-containing protein n=1 Tax=Crassaminicella thermophila TaxID=2599308 RepID=UPI00143D267B|nr:ribonuclease H-like domain-containing protein [Crassaminicella thermophila]